MKNLRRTKNMTPVYAALLLSAFSFGTDAHAEIVEKQGVSAAEILTIIPDLKIKQDGLSVNFFGEMPARCAEEAKIIKSENTLMFVMPKCENNFSPIKDEKTVAVSDVYRRIQLQDLSGAIMIRHLPRGDANDKDRQVKEELKDAKGQSVVLESSEDILAREREEQDIADRARAEKESKALAAKLDLLCKKGDYVGLGEEIQRASGLLGDVSDLLEKIDSAQMHKYKKDLSDSENAEEAKSIFEAYLLAASEKGWDEDFLNDLYVEKRFTFISDMASDEETASSQIASELKDWNSELRGINRKLYKEHKKDIAISYGDLFAREMKKDNMDEAIKYANAAKRLSPASDAEKFDVTVASYYTEKFKACVEKGPWKMESCEKKFANVGQQYADQAKASKGARANTGDEEAMEEYANFMSDYTQTYGSSPTYNYKGFGKTSRNPAGAGLLEQFKYQQAVQYTQEQQMQMQQQYQQQYQQQLMMGQQYRPY